MLWRIVPGEQERLLEDDRPGSRPDAQGAGVRGDQSGDQLDERALARAGRSDDRHDTTAGDVERDPVEGRAVLGRERELEGVHLDAPAVVGGRDRQHRVGLDRLVEHLADPRPAGERERQLRQHVADQPEGEHQEREQVDEARQLADGEVAAAHPVGTDQDQADVGQRREHVEQRFERPPQANGVDPGVAQPAGDGGEPLGLPGLGAVGLDQLHALEALVDARRQLAQVLLRLVVEAVRPPLVDDVDADEEREDGDRDRAEDEVGDQQPDRRYDRPAAQFPIANGTGASTATAVSVSTPARPTRSPSGRRWCHEIGWRMSRSTTPCPSDRATRHCVLPAHVRRTTTPAARTSPITMISPAPAATVPAATSPSSKRGRMTWSITHSTASADATVHKAKTAAPATARTNGRGCSRTWAAIIPNPLRARSNRLVTVGEPTDRFYQRPRSATHPIPPAVE